MTIVPINWILDPMFELANFSRIVKTAYKTENLKIVPFECSKPFLCSKILKKQVWNYDTICFSSDLQKKRKNKLCSFTYCFLYPVYRFMLYILSSVKKISENQCVQKVNLELVINPKSTWSGIIYAKIVWTVTTSFDSVFCTLCTFIPSSYDKLRPLCI